MGQTQPHSTAQPTAPAVGQYGQQHYNGASPQGPAIQPRQVNPGIASDFRSSTPPRRTIDDLDIIRRAKRPPAKGFRRFLFKLTGGKVNPGQSQAELEYLELVKRINQPSRGVYKIAFVSLKGGVGKTTAAKTVGSTFASLRGDRVIAIDANPDAGTLADREHREHRYTVRGLLADHHIRTYSDVRHYTSQGDSRLEILANETDPATSEAFNEQDCLDAPKTLEVHYNIIITDCGTGMMHSAMKGILDEADAVVVVSPTAQDGARSAVSTLAWLNEQGHQRLVEKAVVVVNSTRPGSSSLDLSQLEDVFRQQGVRAVRIIPFDEHLGEGGPIDLPLLSKKTERAYLELAADLADDFVNKGPA
ncbi:MinD/ParA family ATP-binding protein [Rhodococcus sp. ADH]|uniref:MinD/ParA family ATP-binding protein n=1 Tax=Rhodococcus sp. ADH TaxID=224843 RepID=UPI000B1108F3|nr:MinD/ParA family protein [Rhodococcus sp. ADH]